MPPESQSTDELSTLEKTRERLYKPVAPVAAPRASFAQAKRFLPHAWQSARSMEAPVVKPHHMKLAKSFFFGALGFFALTLVAAGYLLYVGGGSVSVNNIAITVQGPSTIAGGDTVPLAIAITNHNPVAIENAAIEADFPPGTRDPANVLQPLSAYNETLGTIKSGETVTRSLKAVVFGASGDTLTIPVSLSYGATGSNSTFVKKYAYPLTISSTPLSISAATVAETVAGKPVTITLQVRSNATVPTPDTAVEATFPFGFSLTSSSVPASGTEFALGTLAAGESRTITLTGTLDGQDGDTRVFHFSIGTKSGSTGGLAVTYMTQDASVRISAPFIETTLTLGGSPLSAATLRPSAEQDVTVTYANTLSTSVTDATVAVTLSGGAVDYATVRSSNGFYDSATHTIRFDSNTDPALAALAPGASGVGTFTFSTVPAAQFGHAPSVTLSTSVSGTRVGQANVPEQVTASHTETVKAATAVVLAAASMHASGPFANAGPIPPVAEQTTQYAIDWKVTNAGSTVAGGVVNTTLPSYVTYTGAASGQGSFSYDSSSRTVTWTVGDLTVGATAEGYFQVSLKPSTSQRGAEPQLTSAAVFAGYDRFAGVNISATADAVSTETVNDPGYKAANATVQ